MTWTIVTDDPNDDNNPPNFTGDMAVHAALVPGGERGHVLYFGGYNVNDTHLYDVKTEKTLTPSFSTSESPEGLTSDPYGFGALNSNEEYNIFCCGHAFLADGRLLIAGGQLQYNSLSLDQNNPLSMHQHGVDPDDPDDVGLMMFGGDRQAALFYPRSGKWTMAGMMNLDPAGSDFSGGRWYPTLVTLGNGQVLAVGGHPDRNENYEVNGSHRHSNNTPERYSPGLNSWHLYASNPPSEDQITSAFGPHNTYDYQRTHLLPNGDVFFASPVRDKNRIFNPHTGYFRTASEKVVNMVSEAHYQQIYAAYTSVLLPMLHSEGYVPRVMLFGGEKAFRINLKTFPASWSALTRTAWTGTPPLRHYVCPVLLPTGDVVFCGGTQVDGTDQPRQDNIVTTAEIYDADIDWAGGHYVSGSSGSWNPGPWQNVSLNAQVGRHYHSIALLLPDGAVWTAGSNGPSDHPDPNAGDTQERRVELFRPWYFQLPHLLQRPEIIDAPLNTGYAFYFNVDVKLNDNHEISRVVLLRCGSCTHGFNPDQRYLAVKFDVISSSGNERTLRVTAPPNGNVAPPGNYLLWVLDNHATPRPCKAAQFIRISDQKCSITEEVSSYSIHEVHALGAPSSPAKFQTAAHVVWEGFLPGEVSTPTVSFTDLENKPITSITGAAGGPLYEGSAQDKDLAQRIAYPIDITFHNTDAFDLIDNDDGIDIWIKVRMGQNQCATKLTLSKHPNPRMTDGEPPWLSTDVRVFRTKPGEAFSAGIVHPDQGSSAPMSYITALVEEYNASAGQSPHPFDALPSTQSHPSKPAIYPVDPEDGKAIYNYAVARVRFRAPEDIEAEHVSVFFRLWTTGWTALSYADPSNANSSYRHIISNGQARPLLGVQGGEVNNIPCFSQSRSGDMATQQDDLNWNKIIEGKGQPEVHTYFGCWLDNNDPTARFPREPGTATSFSNNLLSIQQLMNGDHQCLVAEIHYPDDTIPFGSTPVSSDDLSQRNIMFDVVDNPGGFASHLAHHTFDIKPSPQPFLPSTAGQISAATHARHHADELAFAWGNLPRDSHVTVYIPQWDVDAVLEYAARRGGPRILTKAGKHSIRIKVTDAAYLPIPGPSEKTHAALISVQLPPNIVSGQQFSCVLRQVDGRRTKVLGTTEFRIDVKTAVEIRPELEARLSVLKYIFLTIPQSNRWHPVFARYLEELSDRVRAIGGNPDNIEPSASGTGTADPDDGFFDKRYRCCTGKVSALIFDCCGDFECFIVADCNDRRDTERSSPCNPPGHKFCCNEPAMQSLVTDAQEMRKTVSVIYAPDNPRHALRVIVHQ